MDDCFLSALFRGVPVRLAAILVVLGCVATVPPPAPPLVTGSPTCATACANITRLGCANKSAQCVPACENAQASGIISYDVMCITSAETCAAVDICQ